MKIVIMGAGRVGRELARVLSFRTNDVVVIDMDELRLRELREGLDIMTFVGNGASPHVLKQVDIEKAEMLLAVSNNSEANIISCSLAKQFNVPLKIARMRRRDHFLDVPGMDAATFGVDHAIIPEYECASDITNAIMNPAVLERVTFSSSGAQISNFKLRPGSPLLGSRMSKFPRPELLEKLRICAIMRHGHLHIPRGNTSFVAFDEVYVAGSQDDVAELIDWASPHDRSISGVIIGGATPLGCMLAQMLSVVDYPVRIIESDPHAAESAADTLGSQVVIIKGESTDRAILEEAGIDHQHAYVAAHGDNEKNILSCILAKRCDAVKVIAVTKIPEYIRIIASMSMIDCCFSPLVASINMLLKFVSSDAGRNIAIFNRIPAEVIEMSVEGKSQVAGQRISETKCPPDAVFAAIIRNDQLVPAVGSAELLPGDRVIMLSKTEAVAQAETLFRVHA